MANRAPGGQPSLTKIAAWSSECVDRNGNKTIDTSSDVDGDGLITSGIDPRRRLDSPALRSTIAACTTSRPPSLLPSPR
ncbi:MAG: hypothetical protein EXR72_23520 [Myxococcales bacterium]|nr:hypothetical protein [Myxococcales bacterium]